MPRTLPDKRGHLTVQLQHAIRRCGLNANNIADKTDIPKNVIYRFLSGQRGMSLKHLDNLSEFLELEVLASATFKNGVRQ